MSRRHHLKSQSRVAVAAPPTARADIGNFGFGGYGNNGHQGADSSRLRGYVYFPQLDTRREIPSYTRMEMLRKGRFLYANHGIAKRVVNGLARMIAGTGLVPQAATRDKAWNDLAEREFQNRTNSQFVFDVGGRYSFASSQQALLRFRMRDGDSASILTDSAAGLGRVAFFEAHQIGNTYIAAPSAGDESWRDGVRHDANNAAQAYRFLGDAGKFTDVPANDVIFFCDYERAGQSRGLTVLAHAINNLLDAAEITSYIKQGVKLANQYGYWIERDPTTTAPSTVYGQGGNVSTVDTLAGPVTLERIYGGGQIPDLRPGERLKFNGASHPHPNNLSLIEFLIRDIAWGVGVSPELLWNIAALGGANTRFILADAQGWIEEQQMQLVRLYCQRVWVYFTAKAMKVGRIPKCSDPEWWKCHWITPPRLTVDFGRDGKLQIDQLKMGVITYSRLLGWQGQDFEQHMTTWLDELAFVKNGLAERDLSWSDLHNWRNVNSVAPGDADAAVDVLPQNNSDAAGALSELLKRPEAAKQLLESLRRLPEAA
jgi:capsid protein